LIVTPPEAGNEGPSVVVVDSSVWIAGLRKSNTIGVRELAVLGLKADVRVGDIILLELLQGARDASDALPSSKGSVRLLSCQCSIPISPSKQQRITGCCAAWDHHPEGV